MSLPFPTEQPENGEPGPVHVPKRQVSRETQSLNQEEVYRKDNPADFDERARENAARIAEIHEFRRENIKHFEPPKKDFFEYDPEEKSKRYDGLKLETIFKFQSTYKALKWGVAVGSMFAFHRYYRSRNINNAAHWFAVMSCVSFFNIWLSYSLQEFILDNGSRKSLSIAQRNEYHENAYNYYVDRVTVETGQLDGVAEPVLLNETGRALDFFMESYRAYIMNKYETQNMSAQEICDEFSLYQTWSETEMNILKPSEQTRVFQMKRDLSQFMLKSRALMSVEDLEKLTEQTIDQCKAKYISAENDGLATYAFKL